MAELDNSFAVNQRGVAIPGLERARIGEQEDENRTEGPDRSQPAERTESTAPAAPDRVSLRSEDGANAIPGAAEEQALREQNQTFETPSQNVNANLDENGGGIGSALQGQVGGDRSIRDATQNIRDLQAEPEGRGPLGGVDALSGPSGRPGLGEINEQIEEEAANTAPRIDNPVDTQDVNESQGSAQERTVQELTEVAQDDGRGQGLAASAPDQPVIDSPSQSVDNLTLEQADLRGSAQQAEPSNNTADQVRDRIEDQEAQARAEEQEQQDQQTPEAATTQRGQNIDELI